ncbi:MAG: cellulose synthase family protein [Planctomycetota bacterium]|jgi:cellulose synthase/poly-beta-1,6-N-acetylglucosamine synthase-like glycosyltransferase
MDTLAVALLVCYLAVIGVICVYGLHRYWLVWLFLRRRHPLAGAAPSRRFEQLPRVTVQLPMFNERRVAERAIEAACAIDYPRRLLQIQVLDDSTDESVEVARRCCERMTAAGHDVQYLHRANRHGYKAGALAEGLKSATGEFIAVFDADFVPPPDVLRRSIHHFTDPSLGMVQTRWAHLNRGDSLLTEIQAMFLDGHFIVEQTAREQNGRWFNFNGTAGIWRRACVEDAGGWQHDTLTEDTDLSYRAQLCGWKFLYLPDICCPAEVPPTVSAFMNQQHRWNKGLIQTAIKMLPRIMASPAPWRTKLEAWFHLTCPIVHVAILMLVVLVVPAMFVTVPLKETNPVVSAALGVIILALGAMAACAFYVASQAAQGRSLGRTLLRLPALMAVGVGISVINSKAVVEALFGRQTPFVRTPKYNGASAGDLDPLLTRRRRGMPSGVIELVLGLLMVGCFLVAVSRPFTLVGAPFLLLFGCGFLAIGVPRLRREA